MEKRNHKEYRRYTRLLDEAQMLFDATHRECDKEHLAYLKSSRDNSLLNIKYGKF